MSAAFTRSSQSNLDVHMNELARDVAEEMAALHKSYGDIRFSERVSGMVTLGRMLNMYPTMENEMLRRGFDISISDSSENAIHFSISKTTRTSQ